MRARNLDLFLMSRHLNIYMYLNISLSTSKLILHKNILRSDVKPEMNFLTLSTRVHDKETAIRFFQSYGVIHQQRLCYNGHQMTLSTVSDRWRCNVRQCRQEIGLRKGTWLERSRMESRTVILFIYCWSQNLATIKFCTEELSIGHTIAVDWKNLLREICAWQLLQTPTIVGGPGLHHACSARLNCGHSAGSSFPICGHHTKELKR